jgi:hypothetical protein
LRGEPTAVVLSAQDNEALRADRPGLVGDLLGGPVWDDELAETIAERAKSPSRDIAF